MFHLQNKRNAFRCQATTVSALIKALLHSLQRQSPEDSIGRRQVESFQSRTSQHDKLLPERQLFQPPLCRVLNAEASMVGARCSVIAATTRGIDGCRST